MNFFKLIYRNITFFRKKHLTIILGVMLSSAILVGALIIGDSVKYSLNKIVSNRLGNVQFALSSGNRIFRQNLGLDLSKKIDIQYSALLQSRGIIGVDGNKRLNNIKIYGVDKFFDDLSPTQTSYYNLGQKEIAVNSYIASKMKLEVGDEVLLRFEKLDTMPKDSPLSDNSELTIAERFIVKYISTEDEFGRFGLRSEQIAPFNIFMPISKLSSLMEIENFANLLLVKSNSDSQISMIDINEALVDVWTLEDSGINLQVLQDESVTELRSDRVFIDNPIIEAAKKTGLRYSELLTYFVNEIGIKNESTPYSFVTGISSDEISFNLQENGIVVNQWIADDLGVKIGSELTVKYFLVDANNNLIIDSSNFIVQQIAEMKGLYADQNLLPDYPGLAESESCLDWHPGIPIDFDKIRKKDEIYWEKYKGTPKAFISLDVAKKIWQNRFGELTAIRFHSNDINHIEKKLNENINPLAWNIQFSDVRKDGLEASSQSVDFSSLFLGLSFFVILSALLLTSIMVLFNLESRSQETGIFMGLGYNYNLIKRIVFSEIGILIFIGSILGCVVGIFYNNVILYALSTIWSDAVGTSALEINIRLTTILLGLIIVLLVNFLIVWLVIRSKLQHSVHNLQRGIENLVFSKKKSTPYLIISIISLLSAVILVFIYNPGKGSQVFAQYFFIGILLLFSGITLAHYYLKHEKSKQFGTIFRKVDLYKRELKRKKGRSLILIALLSSSLFIVFTVGINKKNVNTNTLDNKSGTGGYTLFGETSIPIYDSFNDPDFRKSIIVDYPDEDLKFVQFKVKSGDDASCLNLNRVKNPQIIGINTNEFITRNSFSFASFKANVEPKISWDILNINIADNVIPGIADASVIQWQLGKSIGDTLKYLDDYGNEFNIVLFAGLENSIFQGNLLISEENFLKRFPSVNGSTMFVTESSLSKINFLYEELNFSLQDYGLNLSTTFERLAEFNKIENTYLSIFLMLGSFGILIGSIGIGIVVTRNVQEQKKELALLQALGFTRNQILSIINSSYLIVLLYGIILGLFSAFTASLPTLIGANSEVPYSLIIAISVLIIISGFGSIFLTTNISIKGNINDLLRND